MNERRLFVVAMPRFTAADAAWLAEIRRRHDPLAAVVAPHITFVFDAAGSIESRLVAHVATLAETLEPLRFVLRRAIVYPDPITGRNFAYLVADEGNRELVDIHDRLHAGFLAAARRRDAPYLPHLTIGAFGDARQAIDLVDRLGQSAIAIAGTIESLRTVAFDGKTAHDVAEAPVGGR